jgi:hypothetical protein
MESWWKAAVLVKARMRGFALAVAGRSAAARRTRARERTLRG